MLGREHHEGGAEDRVRARCENGNVQLEVVDPEEQLGALGAADPVALDRLRPFRPVEHRVVIEQCVGIRGDAEKPLLEVARLDLGAAQLAAAVDHLLVREHGLVVRAPLHGRRLAVSEPGLQELQEQPLGPAVVLRLVSRDFAIPVDRPAEPAHLGADRGDVPLGDLTRMAAAADRRVLCRQAERVEPHRPQNREAVAAPEMRDDVPQRVVEDVAHMEVPGGVRKHLEHVELLALGGAGGLGIGDVERPRVLPGLLPFWFDLFRLVPIHHASRNEKSLSIREAVGSCRGSAALLPWTTEAAASLPGL